MIEKLEEIIVEYVDVDLNSVTEESRFMEGLGSSSYDFMTVIGEIEETLDIEMEEREVVNVKTAGEVAAYVEALQD